MISRIAQAEGASSLPGDILFLWWLALGIALFVVVPVVVFLLHRLLRTVGRVEGSGNRTVERRRNRGPEHGHHLAARRYR